MGQQEDSMHRHRFFALPLAAFMSMILAVCCGSDGDDSNSNNQSAPSAWFKNYGGTNDDEGESVKQTSDGGYIIVGSTELDTRGYDVLVIKTDAKGNLIWTKHYGGSGDDFGRSVQQTGEGGYIVLGEYAGSSSRQMWLIKLNSEGDQEWSRDYGYNDQDECAAELQLTSDRGYILIGTTHPLSLQLDMEDKAFLVKTDGFGNTQWYEEKGYDFYLQSGASIQQTLDGGYIFTGMTNRFDQTAMNEYGDIWLVKLGQDGGTIWYPHYGVEGVLEQGTSVRQTKDGGYIVAGETGPLSNIDILLYRFDSSSRLLWGIKNLGGPQSDWGAVVRQTSDRGYIISASTYSYGAGGSDGYLIKTDAYGNTLWTNTFGGPGNDYFRSVEQTADGGYIMTGYTESYTNGASDVFLVKTDKDGRSLP
jgi:hypothetical protein